MSVSQLLLLQPTCLEVARHTLYQKKIIILLQGKGCQPALKHQQLLDPAKLHFLGGPSRTGSAGSLSMEVVGEMGIAL